MFEISFASRVGIPWT
ncbi:hypothetical protein Zm00014a_027335 [Zea mays]|uniref:Uncharacterized protein n=1 Tax=Zea mays TaxID=4577 RepID=A0A317Y1D0_MAIZE|nr:hypothetical protein Zm00014a_027335 [Zea mays]